MKSLEVARWRQGRTDIIKFDHLRPAGSEENRGRYDPELSFVGLSPDLGSFYYQELSPSRAFVNLGRASVGTRQAEGLESFTYRSRIGSAAFSRDGRLALLPERGRGGQEDDDWPYQAAGAFYIYDQDSGREVAYMSDRTRHPAGLRGAAFLNDSARVLSFGRDGGVRLWDLKNSRPVNLLSWFFSPNGNWVLVDDEGRFDSPAPGHLDGFHWVVAGSGQPALPLASTFRDYYQPRLAALVQARWPLSALKPLAERSLSLPEVKIREITAEANAPGRVAVTVEVASASGQTTAPVSELKLFRDGRLLARLGGPGESLKMTEGRFLTTFHNLALPALADQAVFSARAVNGDGLSSSAASAAIRYRGRGGQGARLHLFSLGVGGLSPGKNLDYAAGDALAYARTLPTHFAGPKAEVRTLIDGQGQARPTIANLRASLQSLSPHLIEAGRFGGAGPDDVVFISLTSRGFTRDNEYRLLLAGAPGGGQGGPDPLADSLSGDDLYHWLANLDAGEIILLLEGHPPGDQAERPAFDLGGHQTAFDPGPMADRGLARLAFDKKARLLTVSAQKDLAAAYGQGGLGLTAYALLAEGLEMKQVGPENTFSFSQWLEYGRRRIPELAAALNPQPSPPGEAPPPPRLFDFGGAAHPFLKGSPD